MTKTDWHSGSGSPHPTGGYDTRHRLSNGATLYLLDGQFHRLDGPAVTMGGAQGKFVINGVDLTQTEHAQAVAAIAAGTPTEWAIAYATGHITDGS